MIGRRLSDYRTKVMKEHKNEMQGSYLATINSLAYAIEARDPCTRGHSERVATYACWLGEHIGLTKKKLDIMRFACRMHDVGKIGVPDHILLKPGKLTLEEKAQIQMHPLYGVEILGDLRFISKGLPIILNHHERFDGKGYPYGLKKDQIPLEVRIVGVADAFDAMTSDRPYRKAMTYEKILNEFKENAGKQFDPKIVKVLLTLLEKSRGSRVITPVAFAA